jgi:hypothetical protein
VLGCLPPECVAGTQEVPVLQALKCASQTDADFTQRGGPDPDHYSAATVSRMDGADGVVVRHGARVACEPTRPTARMV